VEKVRESVIWKILDVVAKLLIPIAIGYFAHVQTSIQIQQRERSLDLTLVSVAWPSLISGNVDQRISVLSLIETFNPELRDRLIETVIRDPGQPTEIAERAQRVLTLEEAPSEPLSAEANVLASYKIDIYFDEDSERDRQLAQAVKTTLDAEHLSRLVVVAPRPRSFLSRVGQPRGYEIRYEVGPEDNPANALKTVLERSNVHLVFDLREVRTSTPGLLSIFIFSKSS